MMQKRIYRNSIRFYHAIATLFLTLITVGFVGIECANAADIFSGSKEMIIDTIGSNLIFYFILIVVAAIVTKSGRPH